MNTTPETQFVLAPGTLLQNGDYEIVQQIGVGGFGITYLAEHKVFGPVAVKELFLRSGAIQCTRDTSTQRQVIPHFDKAQFEAFKERFMSEARTIFSLRSIKGVVQVLHFFEENGTVYYAMEYLEGENLDKFVKRNHPIAEQKARRIVNDISETLAGIHRRNVLHCDVKPSNVIISDTGQVKLIDFGIARTFQVGNDGTHTTFYSPCYSPPEQKISTAPMGAFSDVYALGATAYFIFTGEPPRSLDELSQFGYRSPRFFRNNIPDAIEEAIAKSMIIKADERLQKVDDFLQIFNSPTPGSSKERTRITIKKTPSANPKVADEGDGPTRADLSSLSPSSSGDADLTQVDIYAKNNRANVDKERTQVLQEKKNPVFDFSKIFPKNLWKHERQILLVGIVALLLVLIMFRIISGNKEERKTTITPISQPTKPPEQLLHYSEYYLIAKQAKQLFSNNPQKRGLDYLGLAAKSAILTDSAEVMSAEIDADFSKTEDNNLQELYKYNREQWNAIRNALIYRDTSRLPKEER
jgi:serine/threonine protein kinase